MCEAHSKMQMHNIVKIVTIVFKIVRCLKYTGSDIAIYNLYYYNTKAQDDEDMLRHMGTLYISTNKLLRTFHYCSTDIKQELFIMYYTSFYCL